MSNKVDKLFKEKLRGHTLQPSAQAWDKVEAHLGKKNKMVLWLRVAAAIAMLGALTFVVLNWDKNYEEPKRELVKEEKKEPAPVAVEKPEVVEKTKEVKKQRAAPKVITPAIEQQPIDQTTKQIAIVPEPEIVPEPQPLQEVKLQEVKKEKGITLTYSLPAIKKEEPVLIAGETKKTGLERVLEIAKEVKNGDNPLGDLREAKDDILAFEFRKDKDKNKNQNH